MLGKMKIADQQNKTRYTLFLLKIGNTLKSKHVNVNMTRSFMLET